MPPSLNKQGPARIVPIKCPDDLRAKLEAVLDTGETVSSVTRELWAAEIQRRTKSKKSRK